MVPPNLFSEDDFPPVEKKLWSSHCFGQPRFNSSFFDASSSSCSGSSLSSPGESELYSTESESDREDEYVAELTRQMSHYMLQEDDSTRKKSKASNLAASLSPTSIIPNPTDGLRSDFQSKQALIDEQIRAIKLNKFNEDKIMKKKQEECLGWGSRPVVYHQTEPNKQIRQVQSNASWANNSDLRDRQRTSSKSVRPVLLGEQAGPKSGSSGTGVFLPRGAGNHSKPREKLGCSTVMIPAKVVHALKLHFDRVGVPSRSNSAIFLLQNADGIIGDVNYCLQLQEKSQSWTAPANNHHNPEISCLPQEWTY